MASPVEYSSIRMRLADSQLTSFLEDLMRRQRYSVPRLAAEIGVCHPTMYRWLSGVDVPSITSCQKIAVLSGVPPAKILAYSGHLPAPEEAASDSLPAFGDYIRGKYPETLDDDIVAMFEELIEARRRHKKRSLGC